MCSSLLLRQQQEAKALMSLFRKIIIGIFVILIGLFLLFVFYGRVEYFINSGTLEYRNKTYFFDKLVLDKVEQSKLSAFIRKYEFTRESNYIQIKEIHIASPPFSYAKHLLELIEKHLIPLYEQKLIDKNETKMLINNLMDIIEKNETKRLSDFASDFLSKYEAIIVEHQINHAETDR